MDIEILSIIADATEKTQKPFLKRTLELQRKVLGADDPTNYLRNTVRQQIRQILVLSEKQKVDQLMEYLRHIIPSEDADGNPIELAADIEWHNQVSEYKLKGTTTFLKSSPDQILNTEVYKQSGLMEIPDDSVSTLVMFCYVKLIWDLLANRAQNEHIAPVINKLISKQSDLRKIFIDANDDDFFESNVVVVSLNDLNIEMKKTIPLLLSRKIYQEQKLRGPDKSLNLIIDEAHNILSRESSREAESWKDYRLETFEEIIKEGRKFGVFVTISSQRPNDISHTITSQAHNYFIHRLINQKDLQSIASAVSYIDKLTEESIPTLPTGTCIFSGMAGQMPLKLAIKPLQESLRPVSSTLRFTEIVPAN